MENKRGRFVNLEQLLPPEITTEILSRLPADSAIGCRHICKQWRSLIDDPSFLDIHTSQLISSSSSSPSSNPKKFGNYLIPNYYSSSSSGFFLYAQHDRTSFQFEFIEYNNGGSFLEFKPSQPITNHLFPFYHDNRSTPMITSCNGLVFMGPTIKPNDMFVCNPFTREYVNLHIPTLTKEEEEEEEEQRRGLERKGYMAYGFGYHPCTNEYKVVSICYDNVKKNKGKVSVYTLGSGKWRNKGEIQYWLYSQSRPGFLAYGAIHWFTYDHGIVSFDLIDEEFRVVVPLLPPAATSTNYVDQYGVLGGCLCVTRSTDRKRCESSKDIWVLNVLTTKHHNNEDEFSWNKKFSIPWKGSISKAAPQLVLKSGKILLHGFGTGLVCYDPETEAFSGNIFPCDYKAKIISYTKSFLSLKALGEEDAKCWGFVAHA